MTFDAIDELLPLDAQQRSDALDPTRSFCVTAPAGSGKTELLSQRVLCLLARAQQPEEILAITFTRKAAAEMRERIYNALLAGQQPEPAQQHRRQTWHLARAVLARDVELGWNLLQNPQRLRVMTIDGLCSSLTAQMPVLSQFGGQPRVVERAQPLYLEAVNALLDQLEQPGPVADSIAELLLHLDNQVERLQLLLAGLLARRDQWLPLLGSGVDVDIDARQYLENTLREVRCDALQRAQRLLLRHRGELLPLLDFAAVRMKELQADAPLCVFAGCSELPEVESAQVAQWQCLADWLLTKDGNWRKTTDKRQGFPVGDNKEQKALFKERKQTMLALLEALGHDNDLREALAELKYLPAACYADSQWQILLHITQLLAQAVAQLNVVFQSRGEVDFTELSLSALRALGSELAPSDLMLRLDARIRHLLIDEFQDTSTTQFHLLERLVEGWREHNENELDQENGGQPQTLFIVGDGMQSIYGFREAKVGLFLDARHNGVNQLELHDAPLTVNFRSTPTIVEWVNKTFKQAFPHSEHIARGAVPYEMCSAFNQRSNTASGSEVVVYGVRNDPERHAEAEQCVRLVQAALQRDGSGSVAILVRYRTHLRALVPALQRAGIVFRATDIDPLAQRAAIQDILALLKALLNPADRIAWLALLRSPLIGLDNVDLHRLIAGIDGSGTRNSVLARLRDAALQRQLGPGAAQLSPGAAQLSPSAVQLSHDAARRVEFALRIIDAALAQRARKPLRVWLEGVWLALGGALSISDEAAWRDVQVLFDLVEKLAPDLDVAQLEERLRDLYARTAAPVTTRVLLMTIHKSKGLEFDTVILPGLDAGTRADDKPLLRWSEYLTDSLHGSGGRGDSALVLAAKSALGGLDDATYDWLHYEHKQKQALEDTRLLYVAATRAIKNLYLLFTANGEEDYRGPASNCLLARIWPAVAEQVTWLQTPLIRSVSDGEIVESAPLWRTPLTWGDHVPLLQIATPASNPLKKWAGDNLEAKIGTVIHRLLEQIIKYGSEAWLQRAASAKRALVESMLLQSSVAQADVAAACIIVSECVDGMLGHDKGRWLLSAERAESVAEWELMTAEGQRYAIDRSFVDTDGVRWIVDYKSSLPRADEALDDFLRRERAAYLPQLQLYRGLVASLDARPIKLALYFPRVPHWLEIE